MTENQITAKMDANLVKIQGLLARNREIDASISSYSASAREWEAQATVRFAQCKKMTLAKNRLECEKDANHKLGTANDRKKSIEGLTAEKNQNLLTIKQLEIDNENLQDQRKSVAGTSQEVSIILANQGQTKAGVEAKEQAQADAIIEGERIKAQAQAEAIAKDGEASAATKKTKGLIFGIVGGIVAILLVVVLVKKFKKK